MKLDRTTEPTLGASDQHGWIDPQASAIRALVEQTPDVTAPATGAG